MHSECAIAHRLLTDLLHHHSSCCPYSIEFASQSLDMVKKQLCALNSAPVNLREVYFCNYTQRKWWQLQLLRKAAFRTDWTTLRTVHFRSAEATGKALMHQNVIAPDCRNYKHVLTQFPFAPFYGENGNKFYSEFFHLILACKLFLGSSNFLLALLSRSALY